MRDIHIHMIFCWIWKLLSYWFQVVVFPLCAKLYCKIIPSFSISTALCWKRAYCKPLWEWKCLVNSNVYYWCGLLVGFRNLHIKCDLDMKRDETCFRLCHHYCHPGVLPWGCESQCIIEMSMSPFPYSGKRNFRNYFIVIRCMFFF